MEYRKADAPVIIFFQIVNVVDRDCFLMDGVEDSCDKSPVPLPQTFSFQLLNTPLQGGIGGYLVHERGKAGVVFLISNVFQVP